MRKIIPGAFIWILALTVGHADRSVTVGKDDSADFSSISAALESITDATPDDPVTIHVRPGTYNETVTTKHWVNIEGDDRDTCVIEYDSGSDAPSVIVKSDVFKAHTNSTLKNLTIIGRRVKYAVHSDAIAKHPPTIPKGSYTLVLENCRILRPVDAFSSAMPPGKGPFLFALGLGLRANQNLVLRNCEIEAGKPIYFHNWGQNEPCSLTLENCVLQTRGETGIHLQSLGGAGRDRLVLHQCRFIGPGNPIIYTLHPKLHPLAATADSSLPQEIQVVGHGNTFETPSIMPIEDDSPAARKSP